MKIHQELAEYRGYLKILARRCADQLLRAKVDSSDLVQETLLNVAKREAEFKELPKEEQVRYLRQCLKNELRDQRRRYFGEKRAVARERSLNDVVDESSQKLEHWIAADFSTPSEQAIKSEMLRLLADAIDSLSDNQRLAFEGKYLDGKTLQEIADELGKTLAQVAGLLRRAKEKLRNVVSRIQ